MNTVAPAPTGEAHTAIRWELGLIGTLLNFLGSQPFVLLFPTLGLGPGWGVSRWVSSNRDPTPAPCSLAADLGHGIRYTQYNSCIHCHKEVFI